MIANKGQKTDQPEILVVDDTPGSLQLLTSILTEHGYRVRPAADGRLALQSVAARLPDLILLDVKMPDMDGYEVCRRLKADEKSRKIPVIFISALGETAEKVEGFKAGGVDYITKPFNSEEVLARVGSHLCLWELTERLEQKVSLRTAELTIANKQLRREITERKQVEEELKKHREHLEELVKERTKELEAFSYSVSHDLKSPLRTIDGFTRILMEDYISHLDEEAQRLGTIIQSNSQKMGQLIDDLLTFSRLGRIAMIFSEIDMTNLANSIFQELTNEEKRKKIEFTITDLPQCKADINLMHQVWTNLISNAIKFSSRRKQAVVSVSYREEENKLIYCIKDNGAGFNMKYKNKLFGVFQRLHSEKEFEGTGVGLALVQRIIHRHGGEVWANGEVDHGAAFYFSLKKTGGPENEK